MAGGSVGPCVRDINAKTTTTAMTAAPSGALRDGSLGAGMRGQRLLDLWGSARSP
jgi:hypothetical protein